MTTDPTPSASPTLWLTLAVQEALEEARRDERRACIAIIRSLDVGWYGIGPDRVRQALVAAIEARGEGTAGEVTT